MLFIQKYVKLNLVSRFQLISDEGFRIDGRRANELRPVTAKLGVLPNADGSASYEAGGTRLIAAVFGPHDVSSAAGGRGSGGGSGSNVQSDACVVQCHCNFAAFSQTEHRSSRTDRKAYALADCLSQVFRGGATIHVHLYRGCQIDINIQVLEADGAVLAAAFNAASLALVDAGIAMSCMPAAASAALAASQAPLMDPTNQEENSAGSWLDVVLDPPSGSFLYVGLGSRLHRDQLEPLLEASAKATSQTHSVLADIVRNHIAQTISTNE